MMVVYKHIRKSDNVIFYIGQGNEKRPYKTTSRNQLWLNTVKKHGYYIEVISTNLTQEEAFNLEIILISFYGRRDLNKGPLVNMTDGGEGSVGREPWNKGRTDLGPSWNSGIKTNHEPWNKNKKMSKEYKDTVSKSLKGNNRRSKKVIDNDTGIIHESIGAAALSIGMKFATLAGKLTGRSKNNTNLRIL